MLNLICMNDRIIKILNIIVPIVIYHFGGVDWVVLYGVIDIDFHLEDIISILSKKKGKKKKK